MHNRKQILLLFALLFSTLFYSFSSTAPALAALPMQATDALVPYSDEEGFFNLQLPAAWEDLSFGPWTIADEETGVLLEVSPDLEDFYNTWETPGLLIGLSTAFADRSGGRALLNLYDLSASCDYEERQEDTLDVSVNGKIVPFIFYIDLWRDCDGTENQFGVIAGMPEGKEFLLFIAAQIVNPEGSDLLEAIIESLEIDGDAFVDSGFAGKQAPSDIVGTVNAYAYETGQMSIELLMLWDDVQSGNWVVDGQTIGLLIEAADDLEAFYANRDRIGIVMGLTESSMADLPGTLLNQWHGELSEECSFWDEQEVTTTIRVNGKETNLPLQSNHWGDCGDTGGRLAVMETAPIGPYRLIAIAQSGTPFESNFIRYAIDSINLNLPFDDISQSTGSSTQKGQSLQSGLSNRGSGIGADSESLESSSPISTTKVITGTDAIAEPLTPANGDSLQLQLNLEQGTVYHIRMLTDQVITQEFGGTSTLDQSIGLEYTYAVTEVDDAGNATMMVTYDWVAFSQSGTPTGDVVYDSDDPPAEIPPLAIGYAALKGQSFTMQMAPSGAVLEIRGLDAIFDNMVEGLDLPPSEADAFLESMKSQFGEEAIKANMEQMTNIYPENPINIEDSWSRVFVIDKGFPMILDNTWTLIERADGLATLAIETALEPNPNAPPLDMGGIELTYELAGTQVGTLQVDEASGWMISGEMSQFFAGDISAEGLTIPMSIESTIQFTGLIETNGEVAPSVEAPEEATNGTDNSETSPDSSDDTVEESSQPQTNSRATARSSARTAAEATDETETSPETDSSFSDESPNPLIVEAQGLAADGEVAASIAAFEEALAADPSLDFDPVAATVDALVKAGDTLFEDGKNRPARERYTQALELDPENAAAYAGRAKVNELLEEYDKVIDDLTQAIEVGGPTYDFAAAYADRAYAYYQSQAYERALSDLNRAIERDPTKPWPYELSGYVYGNIADYAEAIASFTAAIELDDPEYNYKWAYINRAYWHRTLGDLDQALADASAAIALDADYTWAYELRGRIYSDLAEHADSIDDFTTAIDLDAPEYDYSSTYGYRGYEYYQLAEYAEAIADLTDAVELDPTYVWAYETRGTIYSDDGQYENAIADFSAAIAVENPEDNYHTVYANRGIAYYNLGDFDNAIMDLTEALQLDPAYTWAYEWRGYAYLDSEQYSNAIDNFTTAIDLDDPAYNYKWAYINRGSAYLSLGQYDEALADFNNTIDLDPTYAWAYDQRGRTHGIMGQYAEAMADYRLAAEIDSLSAESWNTLCWYGSLYGYAEEVVYDACESAVAFADKSDAFYYQDSRGVARALTGDADGALEDFRAFIEGYGEQELRLSWIERLEAGEDPVKIFDAETIKLLIDESLPLVQEDLSKADPGSSNDPDDEGGQEGYVDFPDVGVRLLQPEGFDIATDFFGFAQEETQSSILITRIPGPFDEVTAGFDAEGLATQKMDWVSLTELTIEELPALLINVTQSASGVTFVKWLLAFGDEDATILITATFPEDYAESYSELLQESILSVSLSGIIPTPVDELVDFTITPSDKLLPVAGVGKMLTYNKDGTIPSTDPADPLFIAAPSLGNVDVKDQDEFARGHLTQTASTIISTVESHEPILIDGLEGYETLAMGEDENAGTPLFIYQVILFDADSYIVLKGLAAEDDMAIYLAEFEEMARSLTRK